MAQNMTNDPKGGKASRKVFSLLNLGAAANQQSISSNPSGLQAKYEDLFMRCNDAFLTTYQNTAHYIWSSIDCFYYNFGEVSRPGELAYKLWQIVARIRAVIMVSNHIFKQYNADSFGRESAPFLLSEMKFLSKAGGQIGKAINILVIFLESSELWRETHGRELDLGADLLETQVLENINLWEERMNNIFGLSPFVSNKIGEQILAEERCLREALFLEHVNLKYRECLKFFNDRFQCQNPKDNWETQDFSEFLIEACAFAERFLAQSDLSNQMKRFCDFINKNFRPDPVSRKLRLPSDTKMLFSAVVNNAAPFRIMYFEHQEDFVKLTPNSIEIATELLFPSLPRKIYYDGAIKMEPDELLTFLFRLDPIWTGASFVPPQRIIPDLLDEFRFYAEMKSPMHLLLLYGGIVFYNSDNMSYQTLFVLDKGCDLFLRHPMKTTSEFDTVNPIIFTKDCHFCAEFEESVGCLVQHGLLDPVEAMIYFRSKRTIVKELFGMVTSAGATDSQVGNIYWQFIVPKQNAYTVAKAWKQYSFINSLMNAIEASHGDWIFKDKLMRPVLLRDIETAFC